MALGEKMEKEDKAGKHYANIQSLYSHSGVTQVNIPAVSGDMGILATHVPSVEALRPGVVEVIEESGGQGKKWFGELAGISNASCMEKYIREEGVMKSGEPVLLLEQGWLHARNRPGAEWKMELKVQTRFGSGGERIGGKQSQERRN